MYLLCVEDERIPPDHLMDKACEVKIKNQTVNIGTFVNINVTPNVFNEHFMYVPRRPASIMKLANLLASEVIKQVIQKTYLNPCEKENMTIKIDKDVLLVHRDSGWDSNEFRNKESIKLLISNICKTVDQLMEQFGVSDYEKSKFATSSMGLRIGNDGNGDPYLANEGYQMMMVDFIINLIKI